MSLEYCIGCWGCWVKTPGQCVISDDSGAICREYISSDLVMFTSPIIMGFTSALLKKAHDKLIPLIHPYFERFENEVHHIGRYDKYPLMGLLLEKAQDTDEDDIEIISDIYHRSAINFKTSLCFCGDTDAPVEEVAHEIDRI
jgi:multimeric flavodoxin WrbA